jgi:hypothetical protein
VSNDRVISEWIGKDLEESIHGQTLRYYLGIRLKRLKKITKNLSQDSWSLGWDLSLEPRKYEAGVLIPRSRCLVSALTFYSAQLNTTNIVSLLGEGNTLCINLWRSWHLMLETRQTVKVYIYLQKFNAGLFIIPHKSCQCFNFHIAVKTSGDTASLILHSNGLYHQLWYFDIWYYFSQAKVYQSSPLPLTILTKVGFHRCEIFLYDQLVVTHEHV